MFRFFFHRDSKFALVVEIMGVAILAVSLIADRLHDIYTSIFFYIYAAEYVFIRFCATHNWYGKKGDCPGIMPHFKLILVITSYIFAIANALLFFGVTFPIYISVFPLAVAVYVNIIFIYFHLRDKDPTPPNFFSRLTL